MDKRSAVAQLRDKLRSDGTSVGSWMQIPHASVAEIMGQCGYDWVAIDLEHGSIGIQELPDLCRALELGGTLPLARLAQDQPKDCKQALDAGVAGVIVPMIASADQLVAVRASCRWPPAGSRGVGFSRANLFGARFEAYKTEAQAPLLIAMIEHEAGVRNVADIAAVEGLDALLIGPYDLSASLGRTGELGAPEVIACMQTVKAAARKAGVACGMHVVVPSPESLHKALADGFRLVAYGTDALFLLRGADRSG